MKERINLKSVIAALIVLLAGTLLIVADVLWFKSIPYVWMSIGCSLIASGLVILLTALLIERREYNPLDEWKIQKIYSTRAERNSEADPIIDKAKYCIDGIAFGLSSFRPMYGAKIEHCLKKGINIRLLTMDPDGKFMKDREIEEQTIEGSIKKTIEDLVKWANDLNRKNLKGQIIVKCYSCMTLDYYWRVDNELYIGPYWYGYKSSDTITYKFIAGGKGFQHYANYFDSLWNNTSITKILTDVTSFRKKAHN